MAKAVFAREQIEELALQEVLTSPAALRAPFPRFTKDLLVSYGPRDRGNGDGKYEQLRKLSAQWLHR